MPEQRCPAADLVAIRAHVETCLACKSTLVEFAAEILCAAAEQGPVDTGGVKVLVVTSHPGSAPAGDPGTPIFREFVKARFETDVMRNLKPSGRKGYGYILQRHVLPVIGDLRLPEIRFETVQDGIVQKMLDAG